MEVKPLAALMLERTSLVQWVCYFLPLLPARDALMATPWQE